MSDMSEETLVEEAPAEAPKAEKVKKDPVPDGWETPVAFAKRLGAKLGSEFRPQLVYGFVKNSKTFPAKQNTDGHWIVDIESALTWFDEKEARKAERATAKAEKEAAAASKAAEAPTES
jgi:hypothetical protein